MNSLQSLRTECRSEWQIPQNKISICTSRSVGSRRLILVEASGDIALAAEYAFALYVVESMWFDLPSALQLSALALNFSTFSILLIADVLHPVDDLVVQCFLNCNVRHRGCRRCSVPMLLVRREPNHIAGANFFD